MTMHRAKPHGDRRERPQRQKCQHQKHYSDFQPAAHASDASTQFSTLSNYDGTARLEVIQDRALWSVITVTVSREVLEGHIVFRQRERDRILDVP